MLLDAKHLSTDIVSIINDLLSIVTDLERQLSAADGQSGDARVWRSRNDALQKELRQKDQDYQTFKKNLSDILVAEIRNINTEVAKITALHQSDPDNPVHQSGKAISLSLRHVVEYLTRSREDTSN